MDSDERYKSNIAFIDLLFNILIGFAFLFMVAFIMMNPIAKNGDIIVPAEFLIVLTWPDESSDDLDIWVKDSQKNTVGFNSKDNGTIFLDRDDLGIDNDMIMINGEIVRVKLNREVVSIRGKIPNEYKISVHLYRKTSNSDGIKIPVMVEVIKINPYRIIYKQTQIFSSVGEVKNYRSFTVNKNGDVINVIDGMESVVPLSSGM